MCVSWLDIIYLTLHTLESEQHEGSGVSLLRLMRLNRLNNVVGDIPPVHVPEVHLVACGSQQTTTCDQWVVLLVILIDFREESQ